MMYTDLEAQGKRKFSNFEFMKSIFKEGDKKEIFVTVKAEDVATFETGNVHPVYSTFALARDAEWCTRQFVLEIRDEDEEGIGTMVYVDHLSPAPVGAT